MTFDEAVIRELNERKTPLEEAIIDGKADNFADYKRMVGEIRGLSYAIQIVRELAAKAREADD